MTDMNWTVMTPCRLAQAEGQFRAACCPQAQRQIKTEHHIQPHNTCSYPRHQRHRVPRQGSQSWRGVSWALMTTWARLYAANYSASHESLDIKIIQKT